MTTYAIGDIQGCFDELQQLLRLIKFDQTNDRLWFVGDLVNRGAKSLEVLRFVKQLGNAVVVLGNHDLYLLSLFHNKNPLQKAHNLQPVLEAHDSQELIDWLRCLPLLYHEQKPDYVLVHAGIYPKWTLKEAKQCAKEVENVLRSDDYINFLEKMYGNQPDIWDEKLTGIKRLRFIINCFSRMRYCDKDGKLDLEATYPPIMAPPGYIPWFAFPERKIKNKIIFGHWASLQGEAKTENIFALDTGCVWGGSLTAMRLEDGEKFSISCVKHA